MLSLIARRALLGSRRAATRAVSERIPLETAAGSLNASVAIGHQATQTLDSNKIKEAPSSQLSESNIEGARNLQLLGVVADAVMYQACKKVLTEVKGEVYAQSYHALQNGNSVVNSRYMQVKSIFPEVGIPEDQIGPSVHMIRNLRTRPTTTPFTGDLKQVALSVTAADLPKIVEGAPLTETERDLALKLCTVLVHLSDPSVPILTSADV